MSISLPTVRHVRDRAARELAAAAVPDARMSVDWILEEVLGLSRSGLLTRLDERFPDDRWTAFESMIRRRMAREPLQHILGTAYFYGLPFEVGPSVLIPRPETEVLIDVVRKILEAGASPRILDVGTGSGCLALTLKQLFPGADVTACDISAEALTVARRNAESLGLDIDLRLIDALDEGELLALGCFDVVVSNPPYVPLEEEDGLEPEVRLFEPREALFPGDDPLKFYRVLARTARRLLTPDGWIIVEIHSDFAGDVVGLFRAGGYPLVRVIDDLGGRPRIVAAAWADLTESRRRLIEL